MSLVVTELTAQDAGLVLKYGTSDQAAVQGLDQLGTPGDTRERYTLNEFRSDVNRTFTTSRSVGAIAFSGSTLKNDIKGQDQLRKYYNANTKFSDARLYLNLEDFIACATAQDSRSAMQVGGFNSETFDKSGVIPYAGELVLNGQIAWFLYHQTASTIAIVAGGGSDDTITDSGSGFVDAGFEAGQVLEIEGSAADDGQYLIKTVAAGVITLDGESVTGEAAGSSITLHGGTL